MFDGEEVPGSNTITLERLNAYKNRTYRVLNTAMFRNKTDAPLADERGDLENIQMKLFKKLVEGDNDPKLDDEDKRILADRGYVKVPMKKSTTTFQTWWSSWKTLYMN